VGFWPVLYPGYQGAIGLESISGPDPLVNPYYRELIHTSGMQVIWDWQLVVRGDTLDQLKPVYDFLNVKYYLGPPLATTSTSARMDLAVYRSDSVWPRAFFTDRVFRYTSASEFADMVSRGDRVPFAAIQDKDADASSLLNDLIQISTPGQVVSAANYHVAPNTTEFTINAPTKGVVVLTEAYWERDFNVTLNGEAARYFRVNHAFKGVLVDRPGTYTVKFSYWPRHFTFSLWASAVGLLLLAMTVVYVARPAPPRKGVQIAVSD
jgi:hypothetical protein